MTALPLRINAQLLREKRACKEGIQIFLNRFGESGELVWYGDERDKKTVRREWALRPYYFWFLTTFKLTNVSGNLSNVSGNLSNVRGDLSNVRGDLTNVSGYLSYVSGDLTNVSGNLSNVRGDLSYVSGRLTEKRAKVLGVHK